MWQVDMYKTTRPLAHLKGWVRLCLKIKCFFFTSTFYHVVMFSTATLPENRHRSLLAGSDNGCRCHASSLWRIGAACHPRKTPTSANTSTCMKSLSVISWCCYNVDCGLWTRNSNLIDSKHMFVLFVFLHFDLAQLTSVSRNCGIVKLFNL